MEFFDLILKSRSVAVFTGAGVSTMSGIPDFRGPHGVYNDPWHGMDVEDIISIDFFHENPDIFYKWAKDVWYRLETYEPNIVHKTLALMEQKGLIGGVFTQNIDMLHHRAGSKNIWELHGSPLHHYCTNCHKHYTYEEIAPIVLRDEVPKCDRCGGVIKPDIVFYGESLNSFVLTKAWEDFRQADLAIVLGSSLTVQPAATLPRLTVENGKDLVIVNNQPTHLDRYATLKYNDLQEVFEPLYKCVEDYKK